MGPTPRAPSLNPGAREPQAEQEEAPARLGPACRRWRDGRGRHWRGRWPASGRPAGRWTGGPRRLRVQLTTRSLPFPLRRAAAVGAMDLAGLLLDEEGTFSLTGFQDFSVSVQPSPPQPRAWRWDPGRSPLGRAGPRARLTVGPGAGRQPLRPCLLEAPAA